MMQLLSRPATWPGLSRLGWLLAILAGVASVVLGGCGDDGERYTPPPATIIRSSDETEPTVTEAPTQAAEAATAAPTAIPPTPAPAESAYPYPYPGQLPGGTPLPTQVPVVYPSPTQ